MPQFLTESNCLGGERKPARESDDAREVLTQRNCGGGCTLIQDDIEQKLCIHMVEKALIQKRSEKVFSGPEVTPKNRPWASRQ